MSSHKKGSNGSNHGNESPDHGNQTLQQYFENVYRHERLSSPKSVSPYRCDVGHFVKFLGYDPLVREITPEMLDRWWDCQTHTDLAYATIRHRVYTVRAIARTIVPDKFPRGGVIAKPTPICPGDRKDADPNSLFYVYCRRYKPEKMMACAAATKKIYLLHLGKFTQFLTRPAVLSDLNDATVSHFLTWSFEGGLSPPSVNQRRHYLLAFWRWCARKRLVEEFPDVATFPEPPRVPRAWTEAQLAQLFRSCEQEQGTIGGVLAGLWWLAIHYVWWDTGERTGATLEIRWDDLDLDTGLLEVPAHVRKGQKPMLYQLKPVTLDRLREIREPGRELIFEFPFNITTFYNYYRRILKRAGLPHGRRDKPQRMRRSFASHLEAAGGNATEALDHTARSVTKQSYLDPRVVKRESPNLLLPDIDVDGKEGAA